MRHHFSPPLSAALRVLFALGAGTLALTPAFAQPDLSALSTLDYSKEGGGLENRIRASIRDDGFDPALADELAAIATDPEASLEGREMALRLLSLGATERVTPAIAPLLLDPALNNDARLLLGRIPGSSVDQALLEALSQATGLSLRGLLDTLGARKTPQAVPAIIRLIHTSDDPAVVEEAFRALGTIGTAPAIEFFLAFEVPEAPGTGPLKAAYGMGAAALLEPGSPDLWNQAIRTLSDRLRAPENPVELRATGIRAALGLNPRDLDVILPLLASEDPVEQDLGATQLTQLAAEPAVIDELVADAASFSERAQIRVLEGLAKRKLKAILPLARSAVSSDNPDLQLAGLHGLGAVGEAADVDGLLKLVEAEAPIGEAAENTLAILPDPATNARLMDAFAAASDDDKSTLVEIIAARGLRNQVDTLLAAAEGADYGLASAIYKAIGDLGTLQQMPVLLTRSETAQRRERGAIERAVVGIGRRYPNGEVTQILIDRWDRADDEQQQSLLRMIGAIADAKAHEFLLPLVDQDEPNALALRFLTAWRDNSIFPDLERLAHRPNWPESAQRQAWNAMRRLTRDALTSWSGTRMEKWEATYLAAPDAEGRRSMIDEVNDWPRADMAEWLATRLDDPEQGAAVRAMHADLLRRLGEE